MTQSQKLAIKLSETRQRLNEIVGLEGDDYTDEIKAEERKLQTEYPELETRYRSALIAEGEDPDGKRERTPDQETRALDRLIRRANIGNVLQAVLEQRSTDGPEKEVQDHFKLGSNQIALEQLAFQTERRDVTPAPSDVGQRQNPIIGQVFPESVTGFLGVSTPTVGVGEQTYTVLSTGASPGTPAENADQAETTGAFSANVLTPKRVQASFFWSMEDQARLAGLGDALRRNLRMALTDKMSDILLNDTDNGLLSGGLTAPDDPTVVVGWDSYKGSIIDAVDGKFASRPNQVRLLIGPATYAHSESIYRVSNAGGNETAFEAMASLAGGVSVNSHVPVAGADNIQDGLTVRRLGATHAVMPTWRAVTLIPDNITKAKSGQVILTAVGLWALKVLRSDGFNRLKFKLA